MIRQVRYGKRRCHELGRMVHSGRCAGAAAFDRDRRANRSQRRRLHTNRFLEIDDGATEETCQMKISFVEARDARVVWIIPRIVVISMLA